LLHIDYARSQSWWRTIRGLIIAARSCLYSKSINSTISNGAVYGWYLNAISAAYHTAVFEVIWPSTVSDLGVRMFPVWLVSGAADGMHFQPFSSWVMYVNAARGAQNVSSPLLSRAHSFSTASLYLRNKRCAGERYRSLEPIRAATGLVAHRRFTSASATGRPRLQLLKAIHLFMQLHSQRRNEMTHEMPRRRMR